MFFGNGIPKNPKVKKGVRIPAENVSSKKYWRDGVADKNNLNQEK